jgi:hypothetical protein
MERMAAGQEQSSVDTRWLDAHADSDTKLGRHISSLRFIGDEGRRFEPGTCFSV